MVRPLRFAIFADPVSARAAFDEMATAVRGASGLSLEPIFVPSYAALSQAIELGACEVAWSPPLVAQGLLASSIGEPLVAVGRRGVTSYYAVLLAAAGRAEGADALSRARVGWVSKLSAAGYVVPALFLRSRGLDPDELFSEQSFFGSHEAVAQALTQGKVDIAATYATRAPGGRVLELPPGVGSGVRVVGVAGPIPGDVIFGAAHLGVATRAALRGAFLAINVAAEGPLACLMGVTRFEAPRFNHFETLKRWTVLAASEPRLRVAGG
jgi:ABC-type phosphate/phosphonate transport system substrate-binding protein